MDLNNLTIFQMANKELNYLTERQKVLAANLANSNTPGYVAKDLTIDGNGVIIEDQLNKVAETKGDYNRMLTIYTSYRNMLKTANTQAGS